jgi:hypothetical protein
LGVERNLAGRLVEKLLVKRLLVGSPVSVVFGVI